MRRRTIIKGLAASAAVIGTARHSVDPAAATSLPLARARPGDARWPDAAAWQGLSEQVGGRLSAVTSRLRSCITTPDAAKADALVADLANPYFIQEQPWASQTAGWLDGWTTDTPAYAVNARNSADIAATVRFARAHNLRLVIKGGAHSYLGQSTAPDSLMIWTQGLDHIEVHDAFVPRGCAGGVAPVPAVSVQSGAKFYQLYNAVMRDAGRYVQGGGCVTVGVGGHIQTGGFGSFSKYGGLGAGSLLEAEVVTADGSVLIANSCQNADLLWALKGGGAGFGITTRLTLATHALPERAGRFVYKVTAAGDDAFRQILGAFVAFTKDAVINPHWGEQVTVGSDNSLGFAMAYQGLSEDQAQAAWKPFLDWIAGHGALVAASEQPDFGGIPMRKWWDFDYLSEKRRDRIIIDDRPEATPGSFWWKGNAFEVSVYLSGYESLWLPESLLELDNRDRLATALFEASRKFPVVLHFNKGLAGATPERRAEARASAIHPDAADAFALVIIASGESRKFPGLRGHEPDDRKLRQEKQAIAAAFARMRELAPDAGMYSSEMGYGVPDWQRAGWGTNYARLLEIKRKYDPEGLFTGHHQVGSEIWSSDGFERKA